MRGWIWGPVPVAPPASALILPVDSLEQGGEEPPRAFTAAIRVSSMAAEPEASVTKRSGRLS